MISIITQNRSFWWLKKICCAGGGASWRGFNLAAVVFPSLCGQIQKVDEEVKECFGVARRRRDCTCPGNTNPQTFIQLRAQFCLRGAQQDVSVCEWQRTTLIFGRRLDWSLWLSRSKKIRLTEQRGPSRFTVGTLCNSLQCVCVFRSVNKLFGFCQWTPRYRLTSPRVARALWLKVWTAEPWEKHCSGTAGCLEVVCKKKKPQIALFTC